MRRSRIHLASGQALIISLLVLGFLTLSFVLVSAVSLSNESQANFVLENKELSAAAATGCMEQAMNRLGLDVSYAGNETLTVASSTCTVRPVIVGAGNWTLETWARNGDQYARYRAVLTGRAPVIIGSWAEIAAF